MADRARGIHVSPGVYATEKVIDVASRSLGITTLGAVGETLRGPAFQPIRVEDWDEFKNIFGGTSPEKFKGSQYPKYELPYIAQSYLEQSRQLDVVRVLGLSGYNAGPAWCVTASGSGNTKYVIAVLRSNGHYDAFNRAGNVLDCKCTNLSYDRMLFDVGETPRTNGSTGCPDKSAFNKDALVIAPYTAYYNNGECTGNSLNPDADDMSISPLNYGRFNLYAYTGVTPHTVASSGNSTHKYAVSLNPNDNDYILKVLPSRPGESDAPIFVESLYDVALRQMIAKGDITKIDPELTFYQVYFPSEYCALEPVNGLIEKVEDALTRKDVGKRFLGTKAAADNDSYTCHPFDYTTKSPKLFDNSKTKEIDKSLKFGNEEGEPTIKGIQAGQIYTVKQHTDKNGQRHYYYAYYDHLTIDTGKTTSKAVNLHDNLKGVTFDDAYTNDDASIVKNNADNAFYRMNGDDVEQVTCDLNNYKSAYRYASTPWVVSNLKGDFNHIELNKLFRFHTISDGASSNWEVKVSIENLRPDEGLFDVVVRDVNDSDMSPVILERFSKCTLVPGTTNYLAYRIGSFDGNYVSRSKYITVEINENQATRNSIPAGFLGYPLTKFDGLPISGDKETNIEMPKLAYNTNFDEDLKNRKQYFGLSDLVGVDVDAFTFKGVNSYKEDPAFLTQGFHLDSRVNALSYSDNQIEISVDGASGYTFDGVSVDSTTTILSDAPIIGSEADMYGTIYEYVNLRKFTMHFYGGFDGWDPYRTQRSNTDDFKMSKYRGQYNDASGEGYAFNRINDPESLLLNQNGITSDYYAYLSGIRQFSNPSSTDINVFCTPGIDYVNNGQLVNEAIEMIEEERADSIYVTTTPDKPSGAGDYKNEMYSADDAVYNLEDSEIDSNYTCTYFPWIKYLDSDNAQYVYLPPTRDVVKNFASTDNTSFPWFAPAGISRGDVSGLNAKLKTKLADEDVLYAGRINPIKTFSVEGAKIWGQKNLQIEENQLNRIAVRRLLLRMRKLIAIACNNLIFEQNDSTTRQSFISAITPIMSDIKSNRGISDYKIKVDDSTEQYDRKELNAIIAFRPYDALEYINLSFVVTPEGVSFDNI